MARSIFTSNTQLRQAADSTGCRRPRATSYCGCAYICPAKPFSRGGTRCRRSSKRNNAAMKHKHLIAFGSAMIVAWAIGTFLFVFYWPHLVNHRFKRAIVDEGFGSGPVPINTLYTEPQALFAQPLRTSLLPGSSQLMTVGVNHDTLLAVGWLDLSKGPLVLHVPSFSGRYYSVQFTDPFDVDFAYVGTRVTGTQEGDCLINGP